MEKFLKCIQEPIEKLRKQQAIVSKPKDTGKGDKNAKAASWVQTYTQIYVYAVNK